MNSTYSHIPWQLYVYGTYAVVAVFLLIYISFAFYSRYSALKSLDEEGFLNEENQ